MSVVYLLTTILFLVWAFRNLLFWVYLWQLKEYRIDRMLAHLRETKQGRDLFVSPIGLFKWFAFLLFASIIAYEIPYVLFPLVVYGIYAVESVRAGKEYFSQFLKRPTFTLKALFIVLFVAILVIAFLFLPLLPDRFLWLLLLDKFIPIIITLIVISLSYPTEFYRDIQIEKAVKKLQRHKKIITIGVTGSYGKSSTKDYIAQILEKKFNVLKTKGTNNTPIGIANAIITGLHEKTEVFVAEMGAYKRGEIKEMCQMVKPQIGVLTAVSPQHMSLFGSLENTIEAKYELMDALPKEGLALFNANNTITRKLFSRPRIKKILYGSVDSLGKGRFDITATNITVHKESISFDVAIKEKVIRLTAPLIGGHNVENILPGIYLANYLGMSENTIRNTISHLTAIPNTMIRHEVKGIAYIDDTFNASPDAVLAAVNYMKVYKGKKILVLQPMIELGKDAKKEHRRVGEEIGKICEYVFLTNKNFYKEIVEGVNKSKFPCKVAISTGQDIAAFITKTARKGDIVVFEGKEASVSLNKIL